MAVFSYSSIYVAGHEVGVLTRDEQTRRFRMHESGVSPTDDPILWTDSPGPFQQAVESDPATLDRMLEAHRANGGREVSLNMAMGALRIMVIGPPRPDVAGAATPVPGSTPPSARGPGRVW